jgi:hypothetical protein
MAKATKKSLKRKRSSKTILTSSESESPSSSTDSGNSSNATDEKANISDDSDVTVPDGVDIEQLPEAAVNVRNKMCLN